MKTIKILSSFKKKTISKCIAFSLLMIAASQASALDVSLCAGETEKMMADGTSVKVWGYGLDNSDEQAAGTCTTVTVPGPQLTVPAGDTALNIMLRNTLSDAVSVMIPGMKATAGHEPVFFADGTTYADGATPRMRVRSLVAETATDASTLYSFVAKAGTHLYQSGTHPAVQVQMGLYGAAIQDAAAGEAYSGITYDNDVVMLYSEIDPDMHDAIAGTADGLTAATYGPSGAVTSTIGYKARYYLVNGESFVPGSSVAVGDKGDRVLIRFLNAGLESHVPVLQGKHMSMVAEYGHAYPFAREQYSVLLAAGATKDAIFIPSSGGEYALYDRRLRLTNSSALGAGGLMSILEVADVAVGTGPVAGNLAINTDEDTPVVTNVVGDGAGLDVTSVAIVAQSTNGTAVANVDGTITYSPNQDFNGADSYSYTFRDTAGVISNVGAVSVTVAAITDAPIAVADAYNVTTGSRVTGNILSNDIDVDGDVLSVTPQSFFNVYGTINLLSDGSFTYDAGALTGTDTFTYTMSDGTVTTTGTITFNVTAAINQAPVANDDYVTVSRNTGVLANSVTVVVASNDSDPDTDGSLDLTSVDTSTSPNNGSVVVNADGTITYTPRAGFRGSDAFSYTIRDNLGLISNIATVRVDVLKP